MNKQKFDITVKKAISSVAFASEEIKGIVRDTLDFIYASCVQRIGLGHIREPADLTTRLIASLSRNYAPLKKHRPYNDVQSLVSSVIITEASTSRSFTNEVESIQVAATKVFNKATTQIDDIIIVPKEGIKPVQQINQPVNSSNSTPSALLESRISELAQVDLADLNLNGKRYAPPKLSSGFYNDKYPILSWLMDRHIIKNGVEFGLIDSARLMDRPPEPVLSSLKAESVSEAILKEIRSIGK